MARKHKTHRRRHRISGPKRHHRRRRISGVGGIGKVLMDTAALVAGAAAGSFVNNAVKTSMATLPAFAPPAVTIAAGLAVEKFAKSNAALANVGTGMVAAGGLFLLNETFLSLPGISGFITNYDLTQKRRPALQNRVGAPGFMDTAIGAARDLTAIAGDASIMGVFDN